MTQTLPSSSRHPVITEDLDAILARPLPWERFDGVAVLIAGAGGMLPAYLVETLLRRNETLPTDRQTRVYALVRDEAKARRRFAAYEGRDDLRYLAQDVSEPIGGGERFDFLIHAASPATPKRYATHPVDTIAANVSGTRNVLERARADGSTGGVLFLSSGEVYGQTPPGVDRIAENAYGYLDPTQVRACYGESKRLGETMCVAYDKQYGVPVRIVRPFHTYGPGMVLDDGRVFADFLADVIAGRDIVIKSDGRAVRAFCYNSDAAAGFFAVLLTGASSRAYNVGNPEQTYSIRELAEVMVGLYPEKGLRVIFEVRDARDGYMPSPIAHNSPDVTKLRALGWNAAVAAPDGFRRTAQWLRDTGA